MNLAFVEEPAGPVPQMRRTTLRLKLRGYAFVGYQYARSCLRLRLEMRFP